jgi:hypothetical protein
LGREVVRKYHKGRARANDREKEDVFSVRRNAGEPKGRPIPSSRLHVSNPDSRRNEAARLTSNVNRACSNDGLSVLESWGLFYGDKRKHRLIRRYPQIVASFAHVNGSSNSRWVCVRNHAIDQGSLERGSVKTCSGHEKDYWGTG